MSVHTFDDRNIKWKKVNNLEHLWVSVLDVDQKNRILHVLYKFAANQKIILHRHKTLNKLWVIQGEHRLYHPNGELKEIRRVGSYTISPATDAPHREGGGADQDVIILFTIYGDSDPVYELLDDDLNLLAPLTFQDYVSLYDAPQLVSSVSNSP
jgi:hypothetical protein